LRGFFEALGLGLLWSSIAAIFGLLQLAILWGRPHLLTQEKFDLVKIVLDGVLLFFATALVSSVTLDYYFTTQVRYSKLLEGLIVNLIPSGIILSAVWLYITTYGKAHEELLIDVLNRDQATLVIASVVYAWGIKALLFFNERNRE
jgi:hypothetical protein